MKIELQTKLLKLKGILNDISHASFSYSQLGRTYHLNTLTDAEAEKLITAYQEIISQVKSSITNNEISTDRNKLLGR